MKFINAAGELAEGLPLTDSQVEQREQLRVFLHEEVCRGGYHAAYERRAGDVRCERVANFIVSKFTLTSLPGTDFDAEIKKAQKANAVPEAAQPAATPTEPDAQMPL